MPDHVHALVWFDRPKQLSLFMNKWKDESSAAIKQLFRRRFKEYWACVGDDDPVWQSRYYPFNVFTEKKLEEKLTYMHMNPVRARLVSAPCDWRWSSARWHLQGKSVGIPIRLPPL